MRRLLVRGPLLALLAVLFLLHGQSAGAIIQWCAADPVVDIGGTTMKVYVSAPIEILDAVTGPTVVEITVPTGVPVTLISTDPGFGKGWDVRFAESDRLHITDRGIEVRVRTSVPAHGSLPVITEVVNGSDSVLGTVIGHTNSWDTVKVWL